MKAAITGVGHFVPEGRLTNSDLEKVVDTSDEWITARTGIRERRILDQDQGTSTMAVKAAQMVLEQTGTRAEDLELILVATVTPDMTVPPMAALVQHELKAVNSWGYDINGACAGFVCALATGVQFIETGRHRKVLVIGADKMSAIVNYGDRNTCVLFGDAAGAVLLEPARENETGIEDVEVHLDGSGKDFLFMEGGGSLHPASEETVAKEMHYIFQDGKAVFKQAVTRMADVSASILKRNGLQGCDVKLLIPHQANQRIIDAVTARLKLNREQVVINIEKYGNTTAATIPLAMSEAYRSGRMDKGDRIVLSAFGAGYTWGSILLRWALPREAVPDNDVETVADYQELAN